MLFNSYEFIFLYLPSVLLLSFFVKRYGSLNILLYFISMMSIVFYAVWNVNLVWVLLASIFINYNCGVGIQSCKTILHKKTILYFGIITNVLFLGFFKYYGFISFNINTYMNGELPVWEIILPLGISFHTFQQIAYLLDVYHGRATNGKFSEYFLFITFFPQLIAGPIVRYNEFIPQLQFYRNGSFRLDNILIGLFYLSVGLFKKAVIGDSLAKITNAVFTAADAGEPILCQEAWFGTLAFTFQIYFDFSGYSDMAIGLSRMFGIRMPANFDSPYKAQNIIEFWRRWHITLSQFLRDHLYIPLGGNKKGFIRKHTSLIITMLLGGLWHGAGWNFIIWGGIHGCLLSINHIFKGIGFSKPSKIIQTFNIVLTFLAVTLTWIFFRSETLNGAKRIFQGLISNPFSSPSENYRLPYSNIEFSILFLMLSMIVFLLPNAQQILRRYRPVIQTVRPIGVHWLYWSPTPLWSLLCLFLFMISLCFLSQPNEFIYFQF